MNQLTTIKNSLNVGTIANVATGVFAAGAILYAASQVKALKTVVEVAKGGK